MDYSAVLFDLDGTLLPMDEKEFVKGYFSLLAKKAVPYGYDPEQLTANVWKGTAVMVKNDGSRTNEEAFWDFFASVYGEEGLEDKAMFEDFYRNEFAGARRFTGFSPDAAYLVKALKERGVRVILATNPLFPKQATEMRIRWAGLEPENFEVYTTYEDWHYCKPNPLYYRELADRLGLDPETCLMVGNDAVEDMAAEKLGMKVFLLTDCLIAKEGVDYSRYPQGGFAELEGFLGIPAREG